MIGTRRKSHLGNTVAHIFQRARSGFVVFYNVKDSLFFITLLFVTARQHGIKVLGMCLMYNHIHMLIETDDAKVVRKFVRDLMSVFSRHYNLRYGIPGKLFDRYGVSFKRGDKAIRTSLAYVNNNPVEDHICPKAEDWRWNLLSYSVSNHPYSEKIALAAVSRRLRKAVATVKYFKKTGSPLTYTILDSIFEGTSVNEAMQLVDHIISEYPIIDYERAIGYYGGYEKMLSAFSYNTGSEYDIAEPFDPHSGQAYKKMATYFANDRRFKDIGDVLRLPLPNLTEYLAEIIRRCDVRQCHAMKFLHIKDARKRPLDGRYTSRGT